MGIQNQCCQIFPRFSVSSFQDLEISQVFPIPFHCLGFCAAIAQEQRLHRKNLTQTVGLGVGAQRGEREQNGGKGCNSILLFLASAKGIWWIMEQPRGSLLEAHPLIQYVFRRIRTWRQHIKMGDYAADTEKATWLYSSALPRKELFIYVYLQVYHLHTI